MKNFAAKLFKGKFLVVGIILILSIAGYFTFFRGGEKEQEFVAAERTTLMQEVSVTGRVKPAQDVDLAFDRSGRVMRIGARVGDRVGAGATLVVLENGDIAAQVAQQEAILKAELSKLEEVKRGARPEELQIQEAKVKSAEIAFEDAKKNIVDKIQDSYTKADDAVRNKADQFFLNSRTDNPSVAFFTDRSTETSLESQRAVLEGAFIEWNSTITAIDISDDLPGSSVYAKARLNQVKTFLDTAAPALSDLTASPSLSRATIDGYKSDISAARTNINTAISNLTAAEEKLRSADSSLIVAKNELLLKQAGSTPETITAQEARVEEVRAALRKYQVDLGRTFIVAPIAGVVTKMEAEVGEIVGASALVMSIISDAEYEMESNVPEADIAKIHVGDSARVTLDAYGDDILFEANVVRIDPAETIVEGVATYKATLQFSKRDERVKSGMTANIDIMTDTKENVVAIPQRAVFSRDGKKFVRVLSRENEIEEAPVVTGLRGSDGRIEIVSGLEEGSKVVLSVAWE